MIKKKKVFILQNRISCHVNALNTMLLYKSHTKPRIKMDFFWGGYILFDYHGAKHFEGKTKIFKNILVCITIHPHSLCSINFYSN